MSTAEDQIYRNQDSVIVTVWLKEADDPIVGTVRFTNFEDIHQEAIDMMRSGVFSIAVEPHKNVIFPAANIQEVHIRADRP